MASDLLGNALEQRGGADDAGGTVGAVREMPRVAGDEELGPGGLGTVQELAVAGVERGKARGWRVSQLTVQMLANASTTLGSARSAAALCAAGQWQHRRPGPYHGVARG